MKTIRLIAFAVALCASAFAGPLNDSANVFGPRAKEVSNAIASIPVTIETRVDVPPGGLKAYADAQASETRGFYVVITTQPREWRVSMNPVGLASSEGVRLAGDAMVARFKRGQFAEGAIGLAQELVRLTQPKPAAVAQRRVEAVVAPKGMSDTEIVLWIVGGSVATVLVVWWIVWALNRRAARLERERRERWTPPVSSRSAPKSVSKPDPVEAQRVFDSYTPEQRRTIIEERHHHHYSSGASTDPLMFYLLMNSAMQPHVHAAPVYHAPAYRAPDPEPERRRESSSDSYSPPSYDSGSSSSFDSGSSSSSDSSGGGGSW